MRKNEDQRQSGESTKQAVTQRLLLTVAETACLLNLSTSKVYTLLEYRCPGGIPVKRFGRSVRIRLSDLRQWIDEQ
jgi:excisionase family DNA binding protein